MLKGDFPMKLFFYSVAAAALITATPLAFAEPPDHHGGGKSHGEHHSGSSQMGGGAPSHVSAPKFTPNMSGPRPMSGGPKTWTGPHGMTKTTASPAATFHQGHNDNYYRRNSHGHNNNYYNNRSRDWNGRSNAHINFNRHDVTAQHHYRYRGGRWNWPHGYAYRRWTFGMTLPSIFWARDYWIDDYYDYGLAPPPPGCVWVRYGNDAVLIDQYSGEILEVVYDQFY